MQAGYAICTVIILLPITVAGNHEVTLVAPNNKTCYTIPPRSSTLIFPQSNLTDVCFCPIFALRDCNCLLNCTDIDIGFSDDNERICVTDVDSNSNRSVIAFEHQQGVSLCQEQQCSAVHVHQVLSIYQIIILGKS